MDEKIDYAKVATAVAKRMGEGIGDSIFELEQWKALATSTIAERDELRRQVEDLQAAARSTEEQGEE